MSTDTDDKLTNARSQGQAQFDSIKEMVEALTAVCEDDLRGAQDDARRVIEEDPLSVEVRSGWYAPGASDTDTKPAEYTILLCTGGPACRIIGRLGEYGEPETATLEVQDWFTPWVAMCPMVNKDDYNPEPILLAYARCFYYGD